MLVYIIFAYWDRNRYQCSLCFENQSILFAENTIVLTSLSSGSRPGNDSKSVGLFNFSIKKGGIENWRRTGVRLAELLPHANGTTVSSCGPCRCATVCFSGSGSWSSLRGPCPSSVAVARTLVYPVFLQLSFSSAVPH